MHASRALLAPRHDRSGADEEEAASATADEGWSRVQAPAAVGQGEHQGGPLGERAAHEPEFLRKQRADEAEKAANEAKKAEAKAKAKARAEARAAEVLDKKVEPTWATLEEALEAGQACKKCLPTTKATKGCRACMGEWFEMIRLRKS